MLVALLRFYCDHVVFFVVLKIFSVSVVRIAAWSISVFVLVCGWRFHAAIFDTFRVSLLNVHVRLARSMIASETKRTSAPASTCASRVSIRTLSLFAMVMNVL